MEKKFVPDDSVYNELNKYAFTILKKFITSPSEKSEIKEFANNYYLSANYEKGKETTSLYYNTILKKIYSSIYSDTLVKSITQLTPDEKIIFEQAKEDIKNIISKEINKVNSEIIKKEIQKNEVEKAKNELSESDISVITDTKENNYIKMYDKDKNTPVIAEMVGNTSVASMIDEEASFIIDGSNNVKNSEDIINNLKKNRITNNNMRDVSTINSSNLSEESKEEIGIIKSLNNSDNIKYDTKIGLAFDDEGKILDTHIDSDKNIKLVELNDKNSVNMTKQTTLEEIPTKRMSKLELINYISDLGEKGVTKDEAQSMLKSISTFNELSSKSQEDILNTFLTNNNDNTNSMEYSNSKKLIKSNDNKNTLVTEENDYMNLNSSAKISSVIISFISGTICGVVIMLLVYFFLTH